MKENQNKKTGAYGIIGAIALLLIGGVAGYIVNGANHVNRSVMTERQCESLANSIDRAVRGNNPDEIEKLNNIYSENCLDRDFEQTKPQPKPEEERKLPETTCGQIEMLLQSRLEPAESLDSRSHVENAKIYANLSERGCPENSLKYKNLAAKELEIARALNDDDLNLRGESVEIVETYKRLQMQQEAARMIEKAKKLTNPAIDFIIELEKIIEE